jgi:hypothetical protein
VPYGYFRFKNIAPLPQQRAVKESLPALLSNIMVLLKIKANKIKQMNWVARILLKDVNFD